MIRKSATSGGSACPFPTSRCVLFVRDSISGQTPVSAAQEEHLWRGLECRVRSHSMSLVEVVVTSALCLILTGTILTGLVSAGGAAAMASQHTAAMCLCQETVEDLRARDFADIVHRRFPAREDVSLTHTMSNQAVVVPAERRIEVTDESAPGFDARRVVVSVRWTIRGRVQEERVETIIYDFL